MKTTTCYRHPQVHDAPGGNRIRIRYRDLANSNVLLLEDDYLQATEVALALEQQNAEVVGPLPCLEDGLRALAKERIDAAILDVRLQDSDVYEIADILRSRSVPFVFMTGYDAMNMPERFRNVRIVLKPCEPAEVIAILALAISEDTMVHGS